MSNQDNNSTNRKLKELLDKTGQPDLPADDFEKEALEGFAMLEKDEALELKQALDSKIYSTVFTEERSKKPYWLAAAAGLILIIGFSVYFIRNNAASSEIGKEVSVAAPKKEDASSPAMQMSPPAPIEVQAEAAPKAKGSAKTNNDLAAVPTRKREVKPAAPEPMQMDVASTEKDEKFISAGLADLESPQQDKPAKLLSESKVNMAAPKEEEPALAQNEKKLAKMKAPEMQKDTLGLASPQLSVSGAVAQQWTSPTNVSAATPPQWTSYTPQASGAASYQWTSPANTTYTVQPVRILVFYDGGDKALQKDIKVKLEAKKLVQKFDAGIVINTSNRVEKIKLKKTYALTKEQQLEVIAILKTLTKFKVDPSVKKSAEYTLIFRP